MNLTIILSFVFFLGLSLDLASAHSWIACADYTEKNGGTWDPTKCRGFARDSANYARKDSFGQDRGI